MAPFEPPVYLLVMTATICPAANAGVRRADPAERLADYERALRFWLQWPHPAASRILLLENSGADLSTLQAIARDENPHQRPVEFLSLPGNIIPEGSNYGFTEMEMLDEGLELSQLRRQTTHLIKTTGRLTFPALGRALDRVEARCAQHHHAFELMVDCQRLGFPRRGADARVQLFVCSHSFYNRALRESRLRMNSTDIRLLEHLIFRQVIAFKGQPGIFLRFPVNIEPVGYSGFKARDYRSPRTVIARYLRAVFRRIAPGYWF